MARPQATEPRGTTIKLSNKKLSKKQYERLRYNLLYEIDHMMANLLNDYQAVRLFWDLQKVKQQLLKVKR